MRCSLKGPATLNSVNKLMNSVTKTAALIILRLKLSPLAFNWFPAPPKDRVSKKTQRSQRRRREFQLALWLRHRCCQHARNERAQTGVRVLMTKLIECRQLFGPLSFAYLILRIVSG